MAYSVLADSPVAWWRLGDPSGTTATDSSGNTRNGTYVGTPTLAVTGLQTGDADTAVTFNGSTQRVTTTDGAWWDVTSITVEAWIKTSTASGVMSIVGRDGSTSARSFQFRLNAGVPEFLFWVGGVQTTVTAPAGVADGTRRHIAATFDGTTAKLLVNRVVVATALKSGNLDAGDQPIIGARRATAGTFSDHFNGTIDEVAYYGTALSESALGTHYTDGGGLPIILAGNSDVGIDSTADLTPYGQLAGTSTVDITSTAALSLPAPLASWDADESQLSSISIESTARLTVRATPVPVPAALLNGGEKVFWERYSQVWPTPTDAGSGKPDPAVFKPTSTTTGIVGRPQVVIYDNEGTAYDVTFYGGVPVQLGEMRLSEPFGYESLELFFPQITTLQGTSGPPWRKRGRPVEVHILDENDDIVFENWFVGLTDNITRGHSTDGSGLHVTVEGLLRAGGSIAWQPPFRVASRDIGHVIADGFNNTTSRPWGWCEQVDTGINTRKRGSRDDTLLGYTADLLSTATTNDGTGQWTVSCPANRPVVEEKDLDTVQWTVTNGAHGVESNISGPLHNRVNRIYGQGIDTDGCSWSNSKFPGWHPDDSLAYPWADTGTTMTVGTVDADTDSGTGVSDWQSRMDELGYAVTVTGTFSAKDATQAEIIQDDKGLTVDGIVGPQTWAATFGTGSNQGDLDGAFYGHLAARYNVKPFLHEGNGALSTPNPNYNPNVPIVDLFVDFGEGVSKDEGHDAARQMLARIWAEDFSGTITLTSDPEEGHRRLIRSGENITLKSWEPGSDSDEFRPEGDDITFHIVGVTVSPDGTVTLDVDTQFRDMLNLAEIHQRNRENNPHPGKRTGTRRRLSETVRQSPVWDCESKAGNLPRAAVYGGLWSVFRIPGGSAHDIVEASFSTSGPASEFAVAVFGKPITPAHLVDLVGNPLTDPGDGYFSPWEPNAHTLKLDYNLRWAWGSKDEPGGYFPQHKTGTNGNPGTLTGDLVDDGGFHFRSDWPPWAWVAVYAADSCYVSGLLKAAPVDS